MTHDEMSLWPSWGQRILISTPLLLPAQRPWQAVGTFNHPGEFAAHQEGDGAVGDHDDNSDKPRPGWPEEIEQRGQEQEVENQANGGPGETPLLEAEPDASHRHSAQAREKQAILGQQ